MKKLVIPVVVLVIGLVLFLSCGEARMEEKEEQSIKVLTEENRRSGQGDDRSIWYDKWEKYGEAVGEEQA